MSFSLFTEKAYSLDITSFKSKGRTRLEQAENLKKQIQDEVKATQSTVVRAYPDKIEMTLKQYRLLSGLPEMITQEYETQEFYLYRTPHNIMEVIVK